MKNIFLAAGLCLTVLFSGFAASAAKAPTHATTPSQGVVSSQAGIMPAPAASVATKSVIVAQRNRRRGGANRGRRGRPGARGRGRRGGSGRGRRRGRNIGKGVAIGAAILGAAILAGQASRADDRYSRRCRRWRRHCRRGNDRACWRFDNRC